MPRAYLVSLHVAEGAQRLQELGVAGGRLSPGHAKGGGQPRQVEKVAAAATRTATARRTMA